MRKPPIQNPLYLVTLCLGGFVVCISSGCDIKFTESNSSKSNAAGKAENKANKRAAKFAGLLGGDISQQTPLPGSTPDHERVTAGVGVGKKGRRLEQDHVVKEIAQPASTYFKVRQYAEFNIRIPHAMQLYKATNGHAPKSHEEFMDQIIKANRIKLPELPQGHRYVYDPQRGELMVERPSRRR